MKTCKNCHYQVYKMGVCQELPCLIRVSSASTWVSTTVLVSSIVYHNWATRESNICKKKLPKINDIMFFFFFFLWLLVSVFFVGIFFVFFYSLTGIGIVHWCCCRSVVAGLMVLRNLCRYPERGEKRPGHSWWCRRWRWRALLANEQTRRREPEELGSLKPRPIITREVWCLRGNLHWHWDTCRYHTCNTRMKGILHFFFYFSFISLYYDKW